MYLLALIVVACRVALRSRQKLQIADVKAEVMRITELALGLVSLIHTLICVRIFQMFDCVAGDHGSERGGTINDRGKRMILSLDYSLDCESSVHKRFEAYAYCMVFVYVLVVPVAMALQKREQAAAESSPGLLSQPFKREYWWFDAADLYCE
jgi:hypothetical protein